MFDRVSFHGLPLTAAIQISPGQQLGVGLHALAHPPGWLESDNPWLYREIGEASDMAVNGEDVSGDINKNESALVFALSKTVGYTFRGHLSIPTVNWRLTIFFLMPLLRDNEEGVWYRLSVWHASNLLR